jgi:Tfp pilus assembly protein PilX
MQRFSDNRGQSTILFAISFATMLGGLGLVTDIGWGFYRKQAAKAAAQAAALAAAQAALQSANGSISCSSSGVSCQTSYQCPTSIPNPPTNNLHNGCLYAKDNDFEVKSGGRQNVILSSGTGTPTTAPGVNSTYWVTVRASESLPQMFSAILGNRTSLISARATAIATIGPPGCVYIMDPTSSGALSMTGTSSLVASCGVYVNSSSSTALTGNGTTNLTAGEVDIVGGYSFGGTINPTPNTGMGPASDPLTYLQPPDPSAMIVRATSKTQIDGWAVTTLQPGVYIGGIDVKNGTAILSPGTYVIKGGGISTQNSNSFISGSGVTIYNTCSTPGSCSATSDYAPFSLSGNSSVSLTAPTSGTYAGILIMEDRSIPANTYSDTFGGGSTAVYTGTIYAPKSSLTLYGNAAATDYTVIVAYRMSMVGVTNVNNNYSTLPTGSPIKKIALVE